ncbi:MAG: C1 family peptidase [Sphingobacteriales bacterium]
MKTVSSFKKLVLLAAVYFLWTACQKEQSINNDPQINSGEPKSLGAVPDDPNLISKVPLFVSPDFLKHGSFVSHSILSSLRKGRPVKRDIIPPVDSIISPSNASTVSNTLTVQVTASDNVGVKSVSLSVDGNTIDSLGTSPYNFTWNTATAGDGTHTLKATARDSAGNSCSYSITVAVNTTITVLDPPPLPANYQLAMPQVSNQGSEGSCVSFAVGYYTRSAEQYYHSGSLTYDLSANVFSPEFLYDQTKASSSCASGSSLINALNFVVNNGICPWNSMPYTDQNGCSTLPDAQQTAEALNYKIKSYSMVVAQDPIAIKTMLVNNHPLVVVIPVDNLFYNADANFIWNTSGTVYYAPHAITICGYDDSKHAFRVVNQWGTSWGDQGYSWIDYDYLGKITYDLYTMNY